MQLNVPVSRGEMSIMMNDGCKIAKNVFRAGAYTFIVVT
jgi:hypothetical protein